MCGPYDMPLRILGYFCVFHIPSYTTANTWVTGTKSYRAELKLEQHPVKDVNVYHTLLG